MGIYSLLLVMVVLTGTCRVAAEFSVELTADIAIVGHALTLSCSCSEPGNYSIFWSKSSPNKPDPPLREVGFFKEDCQPYGNHREDLYEFTCSQDKVTFNLTIKQASSATDGEVWRCQATSESNERAFASTTLQVHSPPYPPRFLDNNTIITSPGLVSAIRGSDITVTCYSNGNPTPEYHWLLPNGETQQGPDLQIVDFQEINVGLYKCIANNTMKPTGKEPVIGRNSSDVEITMLYPPTIDDIDDAILKEGEDYNITCPFTPGDPDTTEVIWTDRRGIMISNNSILWLDNVTRADGGVYTCTVTNIMVPSSGVAKEGEASKDHILDVQYEAEITGVNINIRQKTLSTEITLEESDENVDAMCSVVANPIATIKLLKDDRYKVKEGAGQVLAHSLTRTCQDNGVYHFEAWNKLNNNNSKSEPIRYNIYCPPSPNKYYRHEDTIRAIEGLPLLLSFHAVGYPVPKFLWHKMVNDTWAVIANANDTIVEDPVDMHFDLRIPTVSDSTYGMYMLDLINERGQYNVTFNVTYPVNPEAPSNLQYKNITTTSVILSWTPGRSGVDLQTFHIEYKQTSEPDWELEIIPYFDEDYFDMLENVSDVMHRLNYLVSGREYGVRVSAENSFGVSEPSNTITFRTLSIDEPGETPEHDGVSGGVVGGAVFGALVLVVAAFITGICIAKRVRKEEYIVSPKPANGRPRSNSSASSSREKRDSVNGQDVPRGSKSKKRVSRKSHDERHAKVSAELAEGLKNQRVTDVEAGTSGDGVQNGVHIEPESRTVGYINNVYNTK